MLVPVDDGFSPRDNSSVFCLMQLAPLTLRNGAVNVAALVDLGFSDLQMALRLHKGLIQVHSMILQCNRMVGKKMVNHSKYEGHGLKAHFGKIKKHLDNVDIWLDFWVVLCEARSCTQWSL